MSANLASATTLSPVLCPSHPPLAGATAGLPSSAPQNASRPPFKRRSIRPPSARDLQIYKMVKIQRAEQWAVAGKFNLHDSRVSQIIRNVHRWIAAGGSPTDPELRDHAARQRVSRGAQRLRLQRAIEVATYAVECDSRPVKTTRRRYVGGTEVWCEEISRPSPEVSLPAVRLLLKAIQALQDFENADEQNEPSSPDAETNLVPAVFSLLCTWRTTAEADGRVEKAADVANLVTSLLNNLLGTTATQTASKNTDHSALKLSADPKSSTATTTTAPSLYENNLSAAAKKNVQL